VVLKAPGFALLAAMTSEMDQNRNVENKCHRITKSWCQLYSHNDTFLYVRP
jgi:hypothetical protein